MCSPHFWDQEAWTPTSQHSKVLGGAGMGPPLEGGAWGRGLESSLWLAQPSALPAVDTRWALGGGVQTQTRGRAVGRPPDKGVWTKKWDLQKGTSEGG